MTFHSWGFLLQFAAKLRGKKELTIDMKTYVHLWNWLLQWGHTITPVTYKTRAEKTDYLNISPVTRHVQAYEQDLSPFT